jgi:hypothetical protein
MDKQLVIQRMGKSVANLRQEDQLENRQMVSKEYEVVPRFPSPVQYHEKYPNVLAYGTVTGLHIPEGAESTGWGHLLFLFE